MEANNKGEFKGSCNMTACQKPDSAVYFNHSTRKYYCSACAKRLNNDPFNKEDALRMWGHDLCTLRIMDGCNVKSNNKKDE